MAHEIFISYSHKDKTTADAICSHLESRGMRVWYAPRDITPGTEWGLAILKGIEEAKIMVLVFTENANLSQQVLREVNNAVNAGLTIFPFRLTQEEPIAGMRYYLSTVHWMDAMNDELENSIRLLGDLCQAVIDKKPVPKSTSGAAASGQVPVQKSRKKAGIIAGVCAAAAAVVIVCAVLFAGRSGQDAAGGTQTASVQENAAETASGQESAAETAAGPEEITETASSSAGDQDESDKVVAFEGDDPADKTVIEHETDSDEVLNLGATSDNAVDDYSETYIDGNNQSNIMNGGYLAYDGEWYYYTGNDNGRMYRMRGDGSDKTALTDIPAAYISVYEGYVYFVSEYDLYRMKPDGSELVKLISRDDVPVSFGTNYARIIDDRIYFGENELASAAIDGSDIRLENQIMGYDVIIDGTYTYYIDPNSGHVYRAGMDGSDAACIYDKRVTNLRIAGKHLFFYESDSGWYAAYDLTTGEASQLAYEAVNQPVITADGIYGSSGNLQIVHIPFDGFGMKLLTEDWADTANVCGNKILYRDGDDSKYYIMDLDGSNKTQL